MGMAVSHCITWFQTQLILANPATTATVGSLYQWTALNLDPRGYLEFGHPICRKCSPPMSLCIKSHSALAFSQLSTWQHFATTK